MMVIDSHVHFGENSPWGSFSPEDLLNLLDDNIDFAICSNLEGIDSTELKSEVECNLKMLEISQKYPKLKPLYVCQPSHNNDIKTTREILEQNPCFVGLKIHPECLKLPADSPLYDDYLKLAQELKFPCLYHSGHIKSRFSSPRLIYKKAQEFPEVPIILGHLSTGPKQSHIAAIEILLESIEKTNSLLYVDTSWIDFAFEKLNDTYEDTIMLIKSLKNTSNGDFTHRILWGSDAPVGKFNHAKENYFNNLRIFITKIQEEFNDDALLANLLYNNSKRLYHL